MLDSENTKKSQEVAELQARVALDEQRDEESRRESFSLKQKIVESEATRESTRKEVRAWPANLLQLGIVLGSQEIPSSSSGVGAASWDLDIWRIPTAECD